MMREVAVRSGLSGSGRGISAEYVRQKPGGENARGAFLYALTAGAFLPFSNRDRLLVGLGALSEKKGTPGRV